VLAVAVLAVTVSAMTSQAAASRRGTSTARRPNVADMLRRTAAACVAAEQLLNRGKVVSRSAVAAQVAAELPTRTVGELREELTLLVSRHVSSLPLVRGDLTLDRYVACGAFRADLGAAFDAVSAVDGADLDGAVVGVVADGLDGARLLDAVVVFESHRHINLVWHQAHRYAPRMRREPEDLFGWGWHGLKVALTRYDPTRNAFSTYACACIVSKIRDGVRSDMPIVKKMLTLRNKVSAAEADLMATLGRMPTLEEVAEHLAEDVERLKLLQVQLALADSSSIDELTRIDTDSSFTPTWLADTDDAPDEVVEMSERAGRVRDAVGDLDEFDARLVQLLVVDPQPLRQVCVELGVTQRQLRQHRTRVFALLADQLGDLATV
jgi:RNA polymerase sporulation-specific sigma factor